MNQEEKNSLSMVIGKKEIMEAESRLNAYKQGKTALEKRIVDEERWWKLRHWDTFQSANNRTKPTSAWLFNGISNKHADAMDNYPEPNVLPRERSDEKSAEALSSILPVIIERNKFEETYSNAWWYKLKHGVAAYGVFWNTGLEEGIGDVDITYIDLLNIFWEPGIKDLQESRDLFVVSMIDGKMLEEEYPQLKGKATAGEIKIEEYVHDDTFDKKEKAIVVDWYYKKRAKNGKVLLHYCKFSCGEVLFATENEADFCDVGWYKHGKYPIVFDVLYPEEGTPVGFGQVAVMRDPQTYIDKLSEIIIENAALCGKPRYFMQESCGVNEEEFLDMSKTIVHVAGNVTEERLRKIDVDNGSTLAFEMLKYKVDELKETSSNRDVTQGGASGVTAASAIAALQEAGSKTSRDMIGSAYRAYTEIMYLVIELLRQFYSETRCFRITGGGGQAEYVEFNNSELAKVDENGILHTPVFDVVIKPQKRSAYSKLSQNELTKEMYNLGFFLPQNAEQALIAVEMMDFDGKQKVKEQIQKGQQLVKQIERLKEQTQKMALIIQKLTGENVLEGEEGMLGDVK